MNSGNRHIRIEPQEISYIDIDNKTDNSKSIRITNVSDVQYNIVGVYDL